jgi:hypothetical protein
MMTSPKMPNIPGMEAMTDTLEFVKNLWGNMGIPGMGGAGSSIPGMQGMNIPGMVMPTLSVEEINKKITDLKAVESWLNLNMGMLRSAIQALEVQAGTLSTLQTMGETFAASMNTGFQNGSAKGATTTGNGAAGNGHAGEASASDKQERSGEPSDKDQSDAAMLTAPLVNAAAWWNMLQDQFNKAVSNAMTESATAAAAAAPAQKTEKPAAREKPRAKSTAATGSSRKGGKQTGKS